MWTLFDAIFLSFQAKEFYLDSGNNGKVITISHALIA